MMLFIEEECLLITIMFYNMDLEFLLSDRIFWYMCQPYRNGALAIWSFIK